MEVSDAAGRGKRARLLTGSDRAVDVLKLSILRICTHASHGIGAEYTLGDVVCSHTETRQSSSALRCLIEGCAARDLGSESPEVHVRSCHSADIAHLAAVDAHDALARKEAELVQLQEDYSALDERLIAACKTIASMMEAKAKATSSEAGIPLVDLATISVPGLKNALTGMRNATTAEPEENYRHNLWVDNLVQLGAGPFVEQLTVLLSALKAPTTLERRLDMTKAIATILAVVCAYADRDFKWPHGSNLIFVLSLLTHSRKATELVYATVPGCPAPSTVRDKLRAFATAFFDAIPPAFHADLCAQIDNFAYQYTPTHSLLSDLPNFASIACQLEVYALHLRDIDGTKPEFLESNPSLGPSSYLEWCRCPMDWVLNYGTMVVQEGNACGLDYLEGQIVGNLNQTLFNVTSKLSGGAAPSATADSGASTSAVEPQHCLRCGSEQTAEEITCGCCDGCFFSAADDGETRETDAAPQGATFFRPKQTSLPRQFFTSNSVDGSEKIEIAEQLPDHSTQLTAEFDGRNLQSGVTRTLYPCFFVNPGSVSALRDLLLR